MRWGGNGRTGRTTIGHRLAIGLLAACSWSCLDRAVAQQVQVQVVPAPGGPYRPGPPVPVGPDGKPLVPPGTPTEPGKPGEPPKPGEPAKPGEPSPEGTKPETPPVVTRPATPPLPPDRAELRVRLDPQGKVRFSFRGQPWVDVVTWLADISGMSLDWQELPGDYLNLTTQRAYSVDEARDLINRHLLARGYSLLVNGEVLNVVNLKKLDPALVPRVDPGELAQRLPHEFVKVSFPLDWLVAEAAVEELTPLMSPHGKLVALKSTNRLEAMDAVINLRSLYKILGDEQSEEGQERLVREFELINAKATEVQQQLQKLLGLEDPNASRSGRSMQGMNPEQLQQMMMQQMEMMQQQGRERGRGGPPVPSKKPDVSLVVNARRNSLLVLAPPDKMAVVAQAVKMLDVAPERTQTLMGSLQRMQVYRLAALDPATLVKLLEESGGLEPTTRVQADERNKAIVVHGSLADQMTIRAVIEKLDGSGRRFHVVPLRRLEADYVAGTVEFMMLGGPEEKQTTSRRSYYFDYFDRGRSDRQETEKDKFRVDADVENNRLLLWANDVELDEVLNLLEKLGEIPDRRGAGGATMRVVPLDPAQDPGELLERIQRLWPQLSPNPLELPERLPAAPRRSRAAPSPDAPVPAPPAGDDRPPTDGSGEETPRPPRGKAARSTTGQLQHPTADVGRLPERASPPPQPWQPYIRPAQLGAGDRPAREPRRSGGPPARELADDEVPAGQVRDGESRVGESREEEEPGEPPPDRPRGVGADGTPRSAPRSAPRSPPVRIGFTPDGRLVLSSSDTAALDQLEQLLAEVAAPRKEFEVFRMKYAKAYWVKVNIEEFFAEEDKEKSSSRSRNYYFFDGPPPQKTEARRRLSKRRPLRFISDPDTNTLLVTGADAAQLRIIADLVELYDQPEPTDSKSARLTSMYRVQWSQATVLAEAVKDVYRDLLSSNDKALSSSPDQRNRPQQQATYIFGEGGEEGDKKTQVSFKGKLSIGIDEVSNTLLISAEGETLLNNVLKMIKELDEAARPSSTVQVLKVEGGVNSAALRQALTTILDESRKDSGSSDSNRSPSSSPDENSRRRRSR